MVKDLLTSEDLSAAVNDCDVSVQEFKKQMRAKKARKLSVKIALYAILTLLAFTMIVPFYWTFMTSLMTNADIYKFPIEFIPVSAQLSFNNYFIAFKDLNLFMYLKNSVIVTSINIVTSLLTCVMMAYAITKIKFRGSKMLYKVFLSSLMLPGMVMVVPTYTVIYKMKMLNSLFSLIIPGMLSVYGVFFMRAFFMGVNDSVGESARIDGAGELRICFQIYAPQVSVGIIILAINTFNGSWNAYLQPSLYLKKDEIKTLVIALKDIGAKTAELGVTMAFSLLFSLPVFLTFIFAQKYFLTGFTLAGTKE